MNKNIILAIATIIILLSVGSGYYLTIPQKTEQPSAFSITDDYGRTISMQRSPQRVISLAPSITEIVYLIGAQETLIGVDTYSDYPIDVQNKTKIGSYLLPNIELMLSLKPDLNFASDLTSEDNVLTMEEKGLTVVVLAPKTIDGIINDIRLVGRISGKNVEAEQIAEQLTQRINTVVEKTANQNNLNPAVYIEYYPYWTYGPGSFGNDLIQMAGGKNIAATTASAYPQITNEFIVSSNPDIIIITKGPMAQTTIDDIVERTGWDATNAVKNHKIFTIDDDIISRPGPRIVDALEDLVKIIHPELFS